MRGLSIGQMERTGVPCGAEGDESCPEFDLLPRWPRLLVSTPAFAQTESAGRPMTRRSSSRASARASRKSSGSTINDAGIEPLARFEDKICPGIVGMAGAQADKLRADDPRQRRRARRQGRCAGLHRQCDRHLRRPAGRFREEFAKTQPGFFTMTPRELDSSPPPRAVASWHVTETRDRDGQELDGSDKAERPQARDCSAPTPRLGADQRAGRPAVRGDASLHEHPRGHAVRLRRRSSGRSCRASPCGSSRIWRPCTCCSTSSRMRARATATRSFRCSRSGPQAPRHPPACPAFDKAMVAGAVHADGKQPEPAQQFSPDRDGHPQGCGRRKRNKAGPGAVPPVGWSKSPGLEVSHWCNTARRKSARAATPKSKPELGRVTWSACFTPPPPPPCWPPPCPPPRRSTSAARPRTRRNRRNRSSSRASAGRSPRR